MIQESQSKIHDEFIFYLILLIKQYLSHCQKETN